VGEVDREKYTQQREDDEESEREQEVSLGHVVAVERDERPGDVVDERPEADEHQPAERDQPRKRSQEERAGEADQSDGDERQLCAREPPGVQGGARPDRNELGHRAHDGDADPPDQQQVDVCERPEPRNGVGDDADPTESTEEEESEPDDKVT